MSLFNRRGLLISPLALAACGFSPVYAPGGSGAALQNRVEVSAPSNRLSFLLVRRLEERLGRPSATDFTLSMTLRTTTRGLEIDPEGNTNRFNIVGVAGYVLRSVASGTSVTSGTVNAFTGYSVTDTTSAALAARRDAEERLMVILADLVVSRLLAAPITA